MRNVVRKKVQGFPNLQVDVDLRGIPELDGSEYWQRVRRAQAKMQGYTHLVVYADREHFSNIEYFTGFDPRFEEALLVIPQSGSPSIIVGNEGVDYCGIIGYEFQMFVCPTFSLPGQPRPHEHALESSLREAGLDQHSMVGVIGWKAFTPSDHRAPKKAFDLPYFIMESLLSVVPFENLTNATELMTGLESGLRMTLETKELLLNEIAGTLSSRASFRVLENLQEGISEIEASTYLNIGGLPINVHPNINFGKNVSLALASPRPGTSLKRGDVVGLGMAYRRSLCHKIGYYVDGPDEEPAPRREFYDRYFRVLAAWYETVAIGVKGGQVYDATNSAAGGLSDFGVSLNPGHLIHTDEWTNTPFQPGCEVPLRSGMMIQCDFTAAKPKDNLFAHAEDGIILADKETRRAIEKASPAAWRRILERRRFMTDVLGLRLSEDVLPVSDLPGAVFPYMRDPQMVLAFSQQ